MIGLLVITGLIYPYLRIYCPDTEGGQYPKIRAEHWGIPPSILQLDTLTFNGKP